LQTVSNGGVVPPPIGTDGTPPGEHGRPASGTPMTGEGGVLPGFARPQVKPITVVAVIFTMLAIAAGLWLLWQLAQIVQWLVIALFLAVAINPAVGWLSRRGVPRAAAILLVYLVLVLGIAGLGSLVVPPLVRQLDTLVEAVTARAQEPGGLDQTAENLAIDYGLGGYVAGLREQIQALLGQLSVAAGPLVALAGGIVGSVTAFVTILLLTFFLLLDNDRFIAAGLNLFHPAQRPRLRRLLGQSAGAILGYVNGNLVISLIAGTSTFIALTVLGIPYSVALALIVALFDLVPLVGGILGAAVVVLVALFIDPVKAGILAVFFLIYQQVENNVLQPVVYKRSVSLHPLAIFSGGAGGRAAPRHPWRTAGHPDRRDTPHPRGRVAGRPSPGDGRHGAWGLRRRADRGGHRRRRRPHLGRPPTNSLA